MEGAENAGSRGGVKAQAIQTEDRIKSWKSGAGGTEGKDEPIRVDEWTRGEFFRVACGE